MINYNYDIVLGTFSVTSMVEISKPTIFGRRIILNSYDNSYYLSTKDLKKIAPAGIRMIYVK